MTLPAPEFPPSSRWRIWVDSGGTFTDAFAVDPAGRTHRIKVLSSGSIRTRLEIWNAGSDARLVLPPSIRRPSLRGFTLRRMNAPDAPAVTLRADDAGLTGPPGVVDISTGDPSPVLAAHLLTGTPYGKPLPKIDLRLATTRATNALLQHRIAPTVFWVTKGFRDLLEIGDQRRPDLFALNIIKPRPVAQVVVEVGGRLSAAGHELEPLELEPLRCRARELVAEGIRTGAIALLHSWANPTHEFLLAAVLREAGFHHVSISSQLAPRIKYLPRATTAVVDAALSPVILEYLDEIRTGLNRGGTHDEPSTIRIMTSAGSMVDERGFAAKDSLLSGPAAGVAGAMAAARLSGVSRLITFDMGGTSTDVARGLTDDQGNSTRGFDFTFTHRVGDVELLAPAISIESVAAGGGSICHVIDGAPAVGPQSAGAFPGPACYGSGGPLTITDVNLLLGRVDPDRFEIPLDVGASQRAMHAVLAKLTTHGNGQDPGPLLEGFLDIACERMAGAIRAVSARKGFDPADHTLVCFGGAGGQHICRVADRLGIRNVLVPPDASLLSAAGLGVAGHTRFAERQILQPLDEIEADLSHLFVELGGDSSGTTQRLVNLRFAGQDHSVGIPYREDSNIRALFAAEMLKIFGHTLHNRAIEVESIRVIQPEQLDPPRRYEADSDARTAASIPRFRRARCEGKWFDVPLFDRDSLAVDQTIPGPAFIAEQRTMTIVEPGWNVHVDHAGALILRRDNATVSHRLTHPRAIRDELLAARFIAIAEEMGEILRRTAISPNIKERLDYSCAILDAAGELIVSAPHIPVHLGALGLCVRTITKSNPLRPGDIIVTNHPAYGGSHLPDVTLIAPAFNDAGRHMGYVACRAHHAEIGGTRPGSMPPAAQTLAEEGIVIPPTLLFEEGDARWERITSLLTNGPWPTRALEDNLADLSAQVASVRRGLLALNAAAAAESTQAVLDAMEALKDRAERRLRAALSHPAFVHRLTSAESTIEDRFALPSRIVAAIKTTSDEIEIDLRGTSGMHTGNMNAPLAVTQSAVIYVLRLLLERAEPGIPVPLNEGLMRLVKLNIPSGLLNPVFDADPAHCPAVAAGNVETSQLLVSTLIRALGLSAESQGTMNNILFGNQSFGFYETICGGAGAGPGFAGTSAVHTHMTNTAITDPEILEHRYPVRLHRFAIRHGSGGAGQYPGGDGVIREIEFLAPVSLSVITQHRRSGPRGNSGGYDGLPGSQIVCRVDGSTQSLNSIDATELSAGDRLVIQTPGGGGWGEVPR